MIRSDTISSQISLRPATKADLGVINKVIERAVKTWNLPERVKRLAMPTYLHTEHDLNHLHIVLSEDSSAGVIGVAACETAAVRDCLRGLNGLLLHGLYVDPDQQRRGTDTRLLSAADAARENGYDGLLVKAQADAEGFFRSQGLQQLVTQDGDRDYPHRFWLDLTVPQAA